MADNDTGARKSADDDGYAVDKLKRQYFDYWQVKRAEREEADEARRYDAGDQYTAEELKVLNDRKQPVVIYNRIQRKIDGIVGVLERLRQDPKAYPRTPSQEEGADIATAAVNYALDVNQWRSISPIVSRNAAIEAAAGIELSLQTGDNGDPDLSMDLVDPRSYFYDPRSIREDFSDARYMGIAKWVSLDLAQEMFPDKEAELEDLIAMGGDAGNEGAYEDDRQVSWVMTSAKKLFLVEHWHKKRGVWHYCFYCGDTELDRGESPFVDEKGQTFCRFIMFSARIDHDGDRYAFVRTLKGPQDEINHRRSKGMHALNTKQVRVTQGSVPDIDELRRQIHRPDGVLEVPAGADFDVLSNAEQVQGNLELLQEAKNEIENYGPNPALVGTGLDSSSGRAIQLLQQAGISELGPFITNWKGWKLRVYRAIWNIVQHYWTAERWVRVTDDEGLAQFIKLNGLEIDPMTGQPSLVNAVGSLDVDIIMDEGPDTINMMQDTFDALTKLAQAGVPVPPQVILTMANLPANVKKQVMQFFEQQNQPDPLQQKAAEIELAQKAADVDKTGAEIELKRADAANKLASIGKTEADTRKANADATSAETDTALKFMPPPETPLGGVEQSFVGPGAGAY